MQSNQKDNKGQTRPTDEGQPKKFVHAKEAPQRKESPGGHDSKVEGEGSYTATRAYQKGVEKTMNSGKVEEKAKEASRATGGPEGESLRDAERRGQMAAKMEDPSLYTKGRDKQR